MGRILKWIFGVDSDAIVHTPPSPPPVNEKTIPIDDYRTKVFAVLRSASERLESKRQVDAADFVPPTATYRIVRYERTISEDRNDHFGTREEGFYVERWVIEAIGYDTSYLPWQYGQSIDELSQICKEAIQKAHHEIAWVPVGSANPHATHADAEKWLLDWMNPVTMEVWYDEQGRPVPMETRDA